MPHFQALGSVEADSLCTRARCPECSFGDIDLNLNGDGRWKVEWHAVPCEVGDSKMHYSIVVSTYYWFSLVVSNTRCAPRPPTPDSSSYLCVAGVPLI